MQVAATDPGGGPGGDVQDSGAERGRFGFGEIAVETDELGPGQHGQADQGDVQPASFAATSQ